MNVSVKFRHEMSVPGTAGRFRNRAPPKVVTSISRSSVEMGGSASVRLTAHQPAVVTPAWEEEIILAPTVPLHSSQDTPAQTSGCRVQTAGPQGCHSTAKAHEGALSRFQSKGQNITTNLRSPQEALWTGSMFQKSFLEDHRGTGPSQPTWRTTADRV